MASRDRQSSSLTRATRIAASDGSVKQRSTHSRLGCVTCRKRKVLCCPYYIRHVRCDERRDICGNCSRLDLACSWYINSEFSQRSRVNNACDRCRKKKVRSIFQHPKWSQSGGSNTSGPADPTGNVSTLGGVPSRTELRQLLSLYFDGPHYFCFYTFLHRPTVEQMFDNSTVLSPLLLIVIATSLHFVQPDNPLPDHWADECRRLVMADIFSPPSTTTLQTLLLLQRYDWHRADHISAWFISGLAVRLAHGLKLHRELSDEAGTAITMRETRHRLLWSCFVMDSMIDGGCKPLGSLNVSSIDVPLPCNERAFHLGLETNMQTLGHLVDHRRASLSSTSSHPHNPLLDGDDAGPGISAFLVNLASLRTEILQYTLQYHPHTGSSTPAIHPWDPGSPFQQYEEKLEQWQRCLPERLRFQPEAIYRRQPHLVNLVTLHCIFHGCYCDLYWIASYLAASRRTGAAEEGCVPPAAFLEACRHGRLRHAAEICKVVAESTRYMLSASHDPVVTICFSLALRVLVIERQPQDSGGLGVTDEMIHANLDVAVGCAKETAKRSRSTTSRQRHSQLAPTPPLSPSLRTYGTFGRIQNSLASRRHIDPVAPTPIEKGSNPFSHSSATLAYGQPLSKAVDTAQLPPPPPPPPPLQQVAGIGDGWDLDVACLAGQPFGDDDVEMLASGWGDGTLTFSMEPEQMDWINQSLLLGV
ncbi:uncharacterized protein N7498_004141 [Penicillium cinerascens]|uniref:Xylanolytic transcriptional activator regulatory domain-containing protein n=1 Tax=Penicillium cinerascens TaxID=70096 RepID=A0A9W9T8J3_9EURO|nr:uncharacterized protein N7498_004141 [Penicillium cinerascens]KAJ5212495.1 hypothetical protein N7498_004141 [Penicillium cinerascens]